MGYGVCGIHSGQHGRSPAELQEAHCVVVPGHPRGMTLVAMGGRRQERCWTRWVGIYRLGMGGSSDSSPSFLPAQIREVRICARASDVQEEEGIVMAHYAAFAFRWSCPFAAATILSFVNPNFFCSSLRGADAPNDFMPMISPVSPA